MPRRNQRKPSISVQPTEKLEKIKKKLKDQIKKDGEKMAKLIKELGKEIEELKKLMVESEKCKLCNQEGGGIMVVLHDDCIGK